VQQRSKNATSHIIFKPFDPFDKPFFIMLSGLPCTGKTTWRNQVIEKLNSYVNITVISGDDIAIQLRDNINKLDLQKLTYMDICNTPKYREQLENIFTASNVIAKCKME
jgi:uridine kinase